MIRTYGPLNFQYVYVYINSMQLSNIFFSAGKLERTELPISVNFLDFFFPLETENYIFSIQYKAKAYSSNIPNTQPKSAKFA